MSESLRSRLARCYFNVFPAYRRTGARITYIAADWSEIRLRLPLNWKTRNYVGTTFGGSMYGAVDPIYMMMLIRRLGPDYVVWDKAATIRFRAPGRSTLFATFNVGDAELEAIRQALADSFSVDRAYEVELVDRDGTVHAHIEKTVYVRRRSEGREAGGPAAG